MFNIGKFNMEKFNMEKFNMGKFNMRKFNMGKFIGMINNYSFSEDLLNFQINCCFWLHNPPSSKSTLQILQIV